MRKILAGAAIVAALASCFHIPAASAQTAASHKYHVGQRVEAVDYGKWFKAVIEKVREDAYAPYRVHPIGYITTMDRWVPESYIRAAGTGPTEPIPGGASGEANDEVLRAMRATAGGASGDAGRPPSQTRRGGVAIKRYHCVSFVGDHLADMAPFAINTGGRYTDSTGAVGTYTVSAGVIAFHGGNYDGQRADYETSNGRPNVHFIGPSGRRRGVIDCD